LIVSQKVVKSNFKAMNKYTIYTLLILVFFAFSCKKNKPAEATIAPKPEVPQSPFVGFYDWEQSSEKNSFTVTISQKNDSLYGTYCAKVRGGAKLDCCDAVSGQPRTAFVAPLPKDNIIETQFRNYLTGTTGKVKMILYGGDIQWKVIEEPQGEYYAFRNALLKRSTAIWITPNQDGTVNMCECKMAYQDLQKELTDTIKHIFKNFKEMPDTIGIRSNMLGGQQGELMKVIIEAKTAAKVGM
jgi:hypothetical protein